MRRRTFIKAAGAAAGVAGGIFLPVTQHETVDLQPFCEHPLMPSNRFDLTRPFSQHGAAWGTNGHIIVRTLSPGIDTDDQANVPNVNRFVPEDGTGWKPWPREHYVVHEDSTEPCPMCEGFGRTGEGIAECYNCCGEGEIWFDIGYGEDYKPCEACERTGYIGGTRCLWCHGKSDYATIQLFPGGLRIRALLDQKVRTLRDVEYRVENDTHTKKCSTNPPVNARVTLKQIIAIRFDGGVGLVAPLLR